MRIIVIVSLILVYHIAAAAGPCVECGDPSSDPAAAAWLAVHGFSLDEFHLLLSWEEIAAGNRGLVHGYRLQAPGSEAFDVYQGPRGEVLTPEDLPSLGIAPKSWELQPVLMPPEFTSGPSESGTVAEAAKWAAGLAASPTLAVKLPALDNAALKRDDERNPVYADKGVLRYGIIRELPRPLTADGNTRDGTGWERVPTESAVDTIGIWRARIESPGALGMRVHFSEVRLPEGAALIVSDAADPSEMYTIPREAGVWSPTCFSSRVDVIVSVPAGLATAATGVVVDQVTHSYRALGELPWRGKAGGCNLDLACYPDWSAAALGVGGLGTVGKDGTLWCTGSLIVDADPTTNIPYFLTANHCVDGTSRASSLEVYWLYQRPACGGSVPDPKTVPRTTGGADFLASSPVASGTDFTLLRLKNAPPAGLVALGVSTEPISLGTLTTCIHHPSGDYKRISFGATVDSGSPGSTGAHLQPLTRFHENLWSEGTTEPGSSGSPLLLRDSQLLIGQLWGGGASCTRTDEPDYYGRFDVTFPIIAGRLGAARSPYDIDGSGSVNAADLQTAINVITGNTAAFAGADVDRSGAVDALDLQLIILGILHSQ